MSFWYAMRLHQVSEGTNLSCVMGTEQADNTFQTIAFTPRPALSLIQLLFLSLVFARYHGRSEAAAGFAINAHGMLINVSNYNDTDITA
jgi:hypothetical protein